MDRACDVHVSHTPTLPEHGWKMRRVHAVETPMPLETGDRGPDEKRGDN